MVGVLQLPQPPLGQLYVSNQAKAVSALDSMVVYVLYSEGCTKILVVWCVVLESVSSTGTLGQK